MAGSDELKYSKDWLVQFELDYKHHDQFDLKRQVKHLVRLAEFYEGKYRTTKTWTDCLKAHALYNSVSSRQPKNRKWQERAFKLQQQYWGNNSSFDFSQQQALTSSLKKKLESIRKESADNMLPAHKLVKKYDNSNKGDDISKAFFCQMKSISVDCSDRMAEFAGEIISKSISIIKPNHPPCDFETIAIGSLARGEATPYSDLEYIFLIGEKDPNITEYFEILAVTNYFQIGNLGETKLSYMAIKELEGWFEDKAMNGFKIDGLSDKAGNIPTGNGLPDQQNKFIVTPEGLAGCYAKVLKNPEKDTALRGDLTAMMTYMRSVYAQEKNNRNLLKELKQQIKIHSKNQDRRDINVEMLSTDVKKFNFTPSHELANKGFAADVKKEIYRFPSILLLDVAIVTETAESDSWGSLQTLGHTKAISSHLHASLELLLAAATYIRLSAYHYHNSQDDRMSVSQQMATSQQTSFQLLCKSQRRWFVPIGLFVAMSSNMIMLKQKLSKAENIAKELQTLAIDDNDPWPRITTLYYTGRHRETLLALRQLYGNNMCENPTSSIQRIGLPSGPTDYEALQILSDTLYQCDEVGAALVLYKHMDDNNISHERTMIAHCYMRLGDYNMAVTIFEDITGRSAGMYYSLGRLYFAMRDYKKSEQFYIEALELYYSYILSERQYDYYGVPIETYKPTEVQKISFKSIQSPEDRLSRIINSSPSVIACVRSLGNLYSYQGQYKLGGSYFKRSKIMISELYGEGASVPAAAGSLTDLGNNCRRVGQSEAAINYYRQALDINRKLSQGAGSTSIAGTLTVLGHCYHDMGEYDESDEYYNKALAINRELSQAADGIDIAVARTMNDLGNNFREMENYLDAVAHYKKALDIYRELSKGKDTSDIADTLGNLGRNYTWMGKYSEAQECLKGALGIFRQNVDRCDTAITLRSIGDNYRAMKRYKEAEDSYNESLGFHRMLSQGAKSSDIAKLLCRLGYNHRDAGANNKAVEVLKQASDMYIEVDPDNQMINEIRKVLASITPT